MMAPSNQPTRPRKLPRRFYTVGAQSLAPLLLGKLLVRRTGTARYVARIVETEAYVGPEDLACHASRGRTARTEIMFGKPGVAYVYLIYGMYNMLNVVAAPVGDPQAVLIRAAERISGLDDADLSGPGKLCRAMHITRRDNGADLLGPDLYLLDAPAPARIKVTPRIGIDYARHWKDAPLRFFDPDSAAVSRQR